MTALISKLNITTLFIYICMAQLWFRCLNITMHTEVVIYSMSAYGVGTKSMAHLIKFHLLQWEVKK